MLSLVFGSTDNFPFSDKDAGKLPEKKPINLFEGLLDLGVGKKSIDFELLKESSFSLCGGKQLVIVVFKEKSTGIKYMCVWMDGGLSVHRL